MRVLLHSELVLILHFAHAKPCRYSITIEDAKGPGEFATAAIWDGHRRSSPTYCASAAPLIFDFERDGCLVLPPWHWRRFRHLSSGVFVCLDRQALPSAAGAAAIAAIAQELFDYPVRPRIWSGWLVDVRFCTNVLPDWIGELASTVVPLSGLKPSQTHESARPHRRPRFR
jgi:hypothetical protein